MSPGVGSYPWISAPALVIDSTFRWSPATFRAMSASTVNVVSTTGSSLPDAWLGEHAGSTPRARISGRTATVFGTPKT